MYSQRFSPCLQTFHLPEKNLTNTLAYFTASGEKKRLIALPPGAKPNKEILELIFSLSFDSCTHLSVSGKRVNNYETV